VRLSDVRFFDYAAHEYISKLPPWEARLSTYGSEFPRFLSTFPPCKDYPVIAEMAKLEWAIADSLNDAEEEPASLSLMREAGADDKTVSVKLQPNLRFVVTRWPLLAVWAYYKKESIVINGQLERKLSRVAVVRNGGDIQLLELDTARFSFWRCLARGGSIEIAALKAFKRDPLFDLLREMIALFRLQLVTGVITPNQKGD
jgi:hypothetical protein